LSLEGRRKDDRGEREGGGREIDLSQGGGAERGRSERD